MNMVLHTEFRELQLKGTDLENDSKIHEREILVPIYKTILRNVINENDAHSKSEVNNFR